MLTLAAMADYITKKTGKLDAVSIAACKTYLDTRYREVYDRFYWQDSQMTASASITAAGNTFAYPANMERVVTIRAGGDHFIDPINPTFLVESDPTIFERQ